VIYQSLNQIADLLMLHGSFNVGPGLCKGKMGIAIFLYHYSRNRKKEIYANFAGNLLDQVFIETNKTKPDCFQNGMAGIGWGIEYLIRNHFVEADTDDVLEELDEKIFNHRNHNSQESLYGDVFFSKGLYFLARIKGHESETRNRTVQGNKEKLIILTNDCDRYLNYYNQIPTINIRHLLSMLYFLLEVKRLKIFQIKVEKLIQNVYKILKNLKSVPDHFFISSLSKNLNLSNSGFSILESDKLNINGIGAGEVIEFPFLDSLYGIGDKKDIYKQALKAIECQRID
jgi:hypothetical protein